jgi:hypothetical protein
MHRGGPQGHECLVGAGLIGDYAMQSAAQSCGTSVAYELEELSFKIRYIISIV